MSYPASKFPDGCSKLQPYEDFCILTSRTYQHTMTVAKKRHMWDASACRPPRHLLSDNISKKK